MKRLETRIRERLTAEFPAEHLHVNAQQFFGLDINEFAIELAKVSMMIGRKLAVDELHIADENPLPLDNLDANFKVVDALITTVPGGSAIRTPWPPADVIIGNPPFLGAKRLKPERGAEYVNAVRKLYPDVMADYCVYWFRRAHDHIPVCMKDDLLAGRAGLVGTQNIRNNQSRVGGLDHVVVSGTIIEAVDNQPWSGEANVNVSIVDWVKTRDQRLSPESGRLWRTAAIPAAGKRGPNGERRTPPKYELDLRVVNTINSSLSDDVDLSQKRNLPLAPVPEPLARPSRRRRRA
jgi:hypothetical protein